MNKSTFVAQAPNLNVNIGGMDLLASPRTFKDGEGNVGWYINGKAGFVPASPLFFTINGLPIMGQWKENGSKSSGNFGWGIDATFTITLKDGSVVPCTVKGNVTCSKSAGWGSNIPTIPVNCQIGIMVLVPGSKKWAA